VNFSGSLSPTGSRSGYISDGLPALGLSV
jgi:hypothetical protein